MKVQIRYTAITKKADNQAWRT